MTQLVVPDAPLLGEILLPQVDQDSTDSMSSGAGDAWQVRVHPPAAVPPNPISSTPVADCSKSPLMAMRAGEVPGATVP